MFNNFFPIVNTCLSCEDTAGQEEGQRRAIDNRWAAAATGIENGVVTAGVVQTVYADRGASHHYAVAG